MDISDIKIGNEVININSQTKISWKIAEDDIEIMLRNPENYILIKDNSLTANTQDDYAMAFHNWCNKLTKEKNPNCFIKITNFVTVYQIKPTGALLDIFKKEVYNT